MPPTAEWREMIADAVGLGCVPDSDGGPSITLEPGAYCWHKGPGSGSSNLQS